jgi:hypothetical protein
VRLSPIWQSSYYAPTINSSIQVLTLQGYNYRLDRLIMNPLVFERLYVLTVAESVGSIDPELFKNLPNLNSIILNLDSLRNFFHQVSLSWTCNLNLFIQPMNLDDAQVLNSSDLRGLIQNSSFFITFTNYRLGLFGLSGLTSHEYDYPGEDFCTFARFPHSRLVVPVIDSPNVTECTQTLAYLVKHYSLYSSFFSTQFTYSSLNIFKMCQNYTKPAMNVSECDFDRVLVGKVTELDEYGVFLGIQFAQEITPSVCIPMVSLVGFVLNIQIIRILRKHRRHDLQEQFYKYMSINSMFNCVYCLIYVCAPLNYCYDNPNGALCSSIYNSYFAQYFKIVVIYYVGESVKLCSNVSYVLMTINRYMLIGKDHSQWLIVISQMNLSRTCLISIAISLLLNLSYTFGYTLNDGSTITQDGRVRYDFYPILSHSSLAFFFFTAIYFFINYFLFLLANTIIEIAIVRRLRKEIDDKHKRMARMMDESGGGGGGGGGGGSTPAVYHNQQLNLRARRRLRSDSKKEHRAVLMVTVNGLVNFLFRLPEVFNILNLSSYFYRGNVVSSTLCAQYCRFFRDLSNLTFILTFSTNCVMYYWFNNKFRQAFRFWANVK